MTNLTKNVGTVTLTGAAEKVTLPASYGWVWVKNMSEGDIFAGLSEDISEGADGVMVIPSGECGRIQADGFSSVYLLGSGNVQIVGQNYADCPFKAAAKGGGSGGSGGGLTLLGTYTFTRSEFVILFNVDGTNIKRGDRLFFELVPSSTSEAIGLSSIYNLIPAYVATVTVSRLAIIPSTSTSNSAYIRYKVNDSDEFTAMSNTTPLTFNVYKWEV